MTACARFRSCSFRQRCGARKSGKRGLVWARAASFCGRSSPRRSSPKSKRALAKMATILIVEDRPTDRQFLATLLGYRGHRVLEASDAVDGLDSAQQNRPQLIISDVLMPSVDGYEFVRRLRQIDGVGQTPVIFYTATYHEREARALAKQCGVVDILTKPSDPEAILATVDAVLSRRSRPAVVQSPDIEPFDREHVRLVNAKLSEKLRDL